MESTRIFFDARKNGRVGVIENEDINLHFAEWWNGEGVDITFSKGNKGSLTERMSDRHMPLSMHDLTGIVTVAMYMGMIDMEEIEDNVRRLEDSVVIRKRNMERVRRDFDLKYSGMERREGMGRDTF